MQLCAGRSADQWHRFAALDPGNSERPTAWHNSTRGHGPCRHQHRSDNECGADTKYVGMRGGRDDERGNARHDGAGQRHGRSGNAGRIAAGLLTGKTGSLRLRSAAFGRQADPKTPFIKPYLMVHPIFRAYVSS